MKEKILTCLKKGKGFVSGQAICEELGVSRTAVWKYIRALKQEGYEIESVTRKGYRLLQSPDLITEETIRNGMPKGLYPGGIYAFSSIDSTNEEARRAAAGGVAAPALFAADRQTAGKGRRGRTWISPGGEDIFFSILLRPEIEPDQASMLTIIAALSGAAAIEKHGGIPCRIKWPNDLLLHDRKVCGILTEMAVEMDEISYVIVGAGFNLNRMFFDEDIADMASSVLKETGRRVDRTDFLSDFSVEFMDRYRIFLDQGSLAPFLTEYNRRLVNTGRRVKVVRRGQEIIRTAGGINEGGELIVFDDDGKKETILSGEVSVRGLYGYV